MYPDDYIRKQTLTNAERYITPELKEYETLVLNAEERILEIERRLFTQVCQQLAAAAKRLLPTAQALAELDVASALAEVAANHNYNRPHLSHDNCLTIRQGRHTEKVIIPDSQQGQNHRNVLLERFILEMFAHRVGTVQ